MAPTRKKPLRRHKAPTRAAQNYVDPALLAPPTEGERGTAQAVSLQKDQDGHITVASGWKGTDRHIKLPALVFAHDATAYFIMSDPLDPSGIRIRCSSGSLAIKPEVSNVVGLGVAHRLVSHKEDERKRKEVQNDA